MAANILPAESFEGDGGEISASVYHLFNPGDLIPLNFLLRGTAHYSFYGRNDDTAANFQLPNDHGDFSVRTGLRCGGVEPTLFPALAMELSVWYEGHLRSDSGNYGYNGDRTNSTTIAFVLGGGGAGLHAAQQPAKFLRPPDRRHERGRRPFQRLPPRRISAAHRRISAVAARLFLPGNQRAPVRAAQCELSAAARQGKTLEH